MIRISKNAGLTDVVTDLNPISTEHPVTGSAVEVRLWLFNDNADKRYTGVSVQPTDDDAPDDSTWVQLAPDNDGEPGTYLAGGAALSMADIDDSDVGTPFWARITTPVVPDTVNKTDIKLKVGAREYAV